MRYNNPFKYVMSYNQYLIMSNQGLRYIANDSEKQFISEAIYTQRARETYISPNKEIKNQIQKDQKQFTTSPARFNKIQSSKNTQIIPPRATPFKRTHNDSFDKREKDRLNSLSIRKANDENKDIVRFSALRKRLEEEIKERQRLQELTVCQVIKIENLTQEINKLRGQKKQLDRSILQIQKTSEQNYKNLMKSQQNVQQLTRSLKEARINQKSLSNLKNLQNQLDQVQERNKKLIGQNQELMKKNKAFKLQLDKLLRESTQDSESNVKGQAEVKRLLHQLQKSKTERQKFLETNLHQLQKRLYQTENQMKKMHIQLNCIDRKKTLSIDEVKSKKDQQIKDLRRKFMKVSKDLRDTKDKIQKKEKKKPKQNPLLRKYRSSQNIGFNSESQELTFQFSSQS